jgi:ribose transport system permease protein
MDDYLRVPSMIFTLGVNAVMRGLMVAHTGGYAPQTAATDLMRTLASERTLGIPNALFVWAAVSVLVVVILQRTPLGRYIYAIGNKEAAAYLAGVDTRRVTVICFALCGPRGGARGRAARRLFHQGLRQWATPICCPRSQRS